MRSSPRPLPRVLEATVASLLLLWAFPSPALAHGENMVLGLSLAALFFLQVGITVYLLFVSGTPSAKFTWVVLYWSVGVGAMMISAPFKSSVVMGPLYAFVVLGFPFLAAKQIRGSTPGR